MEKKERLDLFLENKVEGRELVKKQTSKPLLTQLLLLREKHYILQMVLKKKNLALCEIFLFIYSALRLDRVVHLELDYLNLQRCRKIKHPFVEAFKYLKQSLLCFKVLTSCR